MKQKKLALPIFAITAAMILVGCTSNSTDQGDADDSRSQQGAEANLDNLNNDSNMDEDKTVLSWDEAPANTLVEGKKYFATFKTNQGDVKMELFADKAPITVNNFVFLSKEGYYNDVTFHRIIDGFMIQGGDPTATGMGGPGYKFEDEFVDGLSNVTGTISMANAGPDTNGSQFFINLIDNTGLDFDKEPLSSGHAVFGKVVEGMDVIEKIGSVETGYRDKPVKDVVVETIVIDEV